MTYLPPGRKPGTPQGTTKLSTREAEVHALRAAGKTWNQVADAIPFVDKATLRAYYRRGVRKIERAAGTAA